MEGGGEKGNEMGRESEMERENESEGEGGEKEDIEGGRREGGRKRERDMEEMKMYLHIGDSVFYTLYF